MSIEEEEYWLLMADTMADYIQSQLFSVVPNKLVVGLSGGIDSAVSAALAVRACGNRCLKTFFMPYVHSDPTDAIAVAEFLDVDFTTIPITAQVDVYFKQFDEEPSRVRKGNKCARERMSILYDQSVIHNALVLGTGNKTEALLGYTTLWGDMACAFSPIGDLYKDEVQAVARVLEIPEQIITKPPSADLWVGQTDEDELGISYEKANIILRAIVDGKDIDQLKLCERAEIEKVLSLYHGTSFKRQMPAYIDLSHVKNLFE